MTRPRAADDFAIRARMEELHQERAPVPAESQARPEPPRAIPSQTCRRHAPRRRLQRQRRSADASRVDASNPDPCCPDRIGTIGRRRSLAAAGSR
jgi:hypothetical protein